MILSIARVLVAVIFALPQEHDFCGGNLRVIDNR
jgi:hypothetical protein